MQNYVPQPPAWFHPKNSLQEDTVTSMQNGFREHNRKQQEYIDDAKRRALEPMAHHIRDWNNRPDAFVSGELRPWTDEAWELFAKSRMPFWRRWLNVLFPSTF